MPSGGILRGKHLGLGVERLHHAAHGVGEEVGAGDSLQIERLLMAFKSAGRFSPVLAEMLRESRSRGRCVGIHGIAFIIAPQHRRAGLGELFDEPVHHGDVRLPLLVSRVDDVEEKVGVLKLFKRRLEGLHQVVGELGDKAHGVGKKAP